MVMAARFPGKICVVTNDHLIRNCAYANGSSTMRVDQLLKQLDYSIDQMSRKAQQTRFSKKGSRFLSITALNFRILRVETFPMVKEVGVKEVPGLYGTFNMDEIILQQIWEEQDFFNQSLHTSCGKRIEVLNRGDWNRAEEGPDFKNAQLLIDGQIKLGDIEIHFQPSDWVKHRHDHNPNFNQVVLQVCVFPDSDPSKVQNVISENGENILTLFLLPSCTMDWKSMQRLRL